MLKHYVLGQYQPALVDFGQAVQLNPNDSDLQAGKNPFTPEVLAELGK